MSDARNAPRPFVLPPAPAVQAGPFPGFQGPWYSPGSPTDASGYDGDWPTKDWVQAAIDEHASRRDNPHEVTSAQVDAALPVWNAGSLWGKPLDTIGVLGGETLLYDALAETWRAQPPGTAGGGASVMTAAELVYIPGAPQTAFPLNVADINGNSYVPMSSTVGIAAFVNGVRLVAGAGRDFEYSSGTNTVTMAAAVPAGCPVAFQVLRRSEEPVVMALPTGWVAGTKLEDGVAGEALAIQVLLSVSFSAIIGRRYAVQASGTGLLHASQQRTYRIVQGATVLASHVLQNLTSGPMATCPIGLAGQFQALASGTLTVGLELLRPDPALDTEVALPEAVHALFVHDIGT